MNKRKDQLKQARASASTRTSGKQPSKPDSDISSNQDIQQPSSPGQLEPYMIRITPDQRLALAELNLESARRHNLKPRQALTGAELIRTLLQAVLDSNLDITLHSDIDSLYSELRARLDRTP